MPWLSSFSAADAEMMTRGKQGIARAAAESRRMSRREMRPSAPRSRSQRVIDSPHQIHADHGTGSRFQWSAGLQRSHRAPQTMQRHRPEKIEILVLPRSVGWINLWQDYCDLADKSKILARRNKTSSKTFRNNVGLIAVSGSPSDRVKSCRGAFWADCTHVCDVHPEASCCVGYSPLLCLFWHPLASRRDASILRCSLTPQ